MSKVPKLRFKEFSEEWKKHYFSDIYGFFQTNSFSRALLNYENGSIKNIHYGDIHTKFKSNFFINKEEVPFINTEIDISKIKDENYCQIKDLIIADASEDYNDIGKAIEIIELNGEKLVAGLHTYIARDIKNKMALGFGGYFIQTHNIRLQMMKLATGISVLGISKSNLSNISLVIPSKKEQEKIASFLISIDTKIEQLIKKEQLLQQYKKGVMQKIFNQEIRFRADDGSEFCEWEGKKLDDVLKTVSTKLYQIKNSDILSEGLFKVVDQGQKTIAGYSNDTEKVYSSGDIIVYGDHTTIVKYIDFDFIVGADGTKLLNTTKDNNLKYMYYNLVFNNIEAEGYKRHFSILRNITLQIPSLKEQIKIANFLSSVDSKIEQVNKQLHSIKEFKKALLQQMFV